MTLSLRTPVKLRTPDGIIEGIICGRPLWTLRNQPHYDVRTAERGILFNQPASAIEEIRQ